MRKKKKKNGREPYGRLISAMLISGLSSIFLAHFVGPTWLWRWAAACIFEVGVLLLLLLPILQSIHNVAIKKEPLLDGVSKTVSTRENTKTEKYIITIVSLLFFPVILFVLLYFLLIPLAKDTIISLTHGDNSITQKVTVWETDSAVGTWFIGQSIQVEEEEGIFGILFPGSPFARREEYSIRYLPNSRNIIEFEKVERTEDTVLLFTEVKSWPNVTVVAEFEEKLQRKLKETNAGYLVKSVQPHFTREPEEEADRSIYTFYHGFGDFLGSVGTVKFSIKGSDADTIHQTILPILKQYPFLSGSKIEIRYKDKTKEDKFGFSAITLE